MSDREDSGGGLWAFILGGALGAAAALLLAPRSGKETRRRLQGWLDDWQDKSEDLLEEGRDILEQGKEILDEKMDQVKRSGNMARKIFNRENDKA
jgi:gas vesicle protein